jgi:hypothetical protein
MSLKKIIARDGAAALLLACVGAQASTIVHVAITLPTEYDDGTPLATEDIKEVVLEWRNVYDKDSAPDGSVTLEPYTKDYEVGLFCGTYTFAGYVVTTEGQKGATGWSAPYDTGVICPPGARYYQAP